MKKRNLLLTLILAVLMPWAANAQETLTVCDGSVSGTTTTTNDYVPIYGLYVDTQGQNSEFIIPAETQGMSDMEGGTISKLAFYITNSPATWGSPTVQVYMGEVEGTTLSSLNGPTNFTTVWTGTLSNQNATMEITLSEPYTYEGGNLLIGMYVQTKSTTYKTTTFSGISAPSGSSRYNSGSGSGYAVSFLPKTTFTYTAGEAACCPKPKNLTCTGYTANTATFTWTNGGEETQWQLEYATASDFTGVSTVTINQSDLVNGAYTLNGLTAEQTYYARLKAYCASCTPNYSDPSNTCEFKPSAIHELTVHDNGNSQSYVPFYSNMQDYKNQSEYIIPAADLEDLSGANITAIKLYGNYNYTSNKAWQVYLREVTDATFSTTTFYGIDESTVVYNGLVSLSSTDGMTITFSDEYEYGGGNLLIGFYLGETGGNYASGSFYGHTVSGASISGYSSTTITPSQRNFIPKTTFTYLASSTPKPRNLVVSDITSESATVTWTAPADNVTGYQYQYKYATTPTWPDTWNSLAANVTHKDLVALAAGTLYDFRVRANYAEGDSDPAEIQFTTEATCLPPTGLTATQTDTGFHFEWDGETGMTYGYSWGLAGQEHGGSLSTRNNYIDLPFIQFEPNADYVFYVFKTCTNEDWSDDATIGFHTPCASYNIPYVYGFEDAAPFDCWTPITGVTRGSSSSNAHNSTYYLRFSGTTSNLVALPQFNEPTNNLRVEFWTRPEGYTYSSCGTFSVGYMTDITDASTFVEVANYAYNDWTSNTHVKKTVDFNNAPANANIAFRHNALATNYYWYVDDVTVKAIPSCLAPTDLAANASTTSAELSWTANSNETAWTVYYKKTTDETYTEVPNATNPYTLNGLTAATNYQYYVVANCSADDASDPSEVFTFSTECDIITIDATHSWEEGFEDYNVGTSEYSGAEVTDIQCWARVQVNSSTHSPFVYRNYSSAASTGLASLEMKTSNNIPVMVALPEFSESIDNLNVAFNYNCTNTNTTYTAELGYITDVTDASTFTKLFDIPTPVVRTDGHSEYSQDLYENAAAANAPAGSRLAILISNTVYSPVPSWNFDDFVVSYVPPCRKPANLALVEGYPTAHEVSFTWDAEEGEMFEYAMLEGTITVFSNVNWGQAEETNTATWNNLNADQNYTLALRKVCGGEDGYSPVVSIPFHTTQEPASIPFADNFEDGQKWALVNGDLTNAWAYGEATNHGGSHALYISNDGGTTNAYGNSYTMVYATKLFNFGDGIYKFSYDWIAYGESSCDYLRVALVPASVTLAAGTSAPSVPSGYFYNNLPEGWIALDGGGKLNLVSDWQSFASDEIEIAAGNYMMVFAWYNDGSVNNAPPAAIDNVSIIRITCITPTNLAYSNVKSTQVNLTWTSDADAWQICINDDEENLVDVAARDVTIEEGVVAYTLTGLTAETPYTVKVRANCGSDDGVSAWTEAVSFTTIAPCSVEDVTISNITHYAADVTWTGESAAGYTVNYRTAATASASPLFSEDFEDETSFANWTFTSMNTANNIESGKAGRLEDAAHNGSYGFRFSSFSSADDYNQYLVSPELTDTGVLKFFYKKTNDNNTETLQVGYSTTTNDYETAFTWIDLTLTTSWQESADITLPENVKYIAFHYYGSFAYYVYVDDITISEPVPAGEWQTVSATSEAISANLSGLTAGTTYDLQVVPNCDETLASEILQFSTVPENVKWFITEGNWGTAANWEPTGAPTIEQDVTLLANTTIESGCVAEANNIITNTHTLTIEDGAQLKHNNSSSFTATVKKNVTGYGADNYNTNNGYVLIGLPCSISLADDNSDGVNLRTGTYDLYTWSSTADLEWINHGSSDNDGIPLALSRDDGFLYANQEGAELIFTGDIYGSGNNYQGNIFYTAPSEEHKFSDWNLIGNPFVCDAYLYGVSSTGLESTLSYYKMNDAGNGFEAVPGGTVIAPMQGIFCQAPSGSYYYYIYFTRTAPVAQSEGKLNMNLRSDNKQLDNAILVFGGEQQLGKMTFRANSSKIYMPVEGKDYAVATAEGNVGEIPVNFKAENNGSYTLSFTSEEVSFSYLHLIDNKTGNDVNLLQTPYYTFDASTSDYESRFHLVFATGSSVNDDNFGFVNASGNFCIFGLEGEATLQVIDMLGHVLSTEQFSGSYEKHLNVAPGVYMIRLIQGNDIKVQKMVVR